MNPINSVLIIAIAASVCTFIAGIIPLTMVPSNNINSTILFVVGGLAQIFWMVPTIRNWGRLWDYIGIAGTLAFIVIWTITRLYDNPITGRASRIGKQQSLSRSFK